MRSHKGLKKEKPFVNKRVNNNLCHFKSRREEQILNWKVAFIFQEITNQLSFYKSRPESCLSKYQVWKIILSKYQVTRYNLTSNAECGVKYKINQCWANTSQNDILKYKSVII